MNRCLELHGNDTAIIEDIYLREPIYNCYNSKYIEQSISNEELKHISLLSKIFTKTRIIENGTSFNTKYHICGCTWSDGMGDFSILIKIYLYLIEFGISAENIQFHIVPIYGWSDNPEFINKLEMIT